MIYIKNNINITEVTLTNATSSELQCIDIGNEIKYRIILAYRPPNNSVTNDEILYENISNLLNNKIGIILGDFNCPGFTKLDQMTAESQRITDFTTDNFLKQWVLKPTIADNILELVFTTEDNIIQNLEIRDIISNSDHKTVFSN
jgi:hypothetical protein